jgi:hypothetical protein
MYVLVGFMKCPHFCAKVRNIILDCVDQERNIMDVI